MIISWITETFRCHIRWISTFSRHFYSLFILFFPSWLFQNILISNASKIHFRFFSFVNSFRWFWFTALKFVDGRNLMNFCGDWDIQQVNNLFESQFAIFFRIYFEIDKYLSSVQLWNFCEWSSLAFDFFLSDLSLAADAKRLKRNG